MFMLIQLNTKRSNVIFSVSIQVCKINQVSSYSIWNALKPCIHREAIIYKRTPQRPRYIRTVYITLNQTGPDMPTNTHAEHWKISESCRNRSDVFPCPSHYSLQHCYPMRTHWTFQRGEKRHGAQIRHL